MKQQTEKSRRRLLKAMAAGGGLIAGAKTLPEKWSSPLVQTTIMPAHATMTTCSIAEGCYNFENFSLYWVGGTGPSTVAYWNVVGCSTEVPPEGSLLVVASAYYVIFNRSGRTPAIHGPILRIVGCRTEDRRSSASGRGGRRWSPGLSRGSQVCLPRRKERPGVADRRPGPARDPGDRDSARYRRGLAGIRRKRGKARIAHQ